MPTRLARATMMMIMGVLMVLVAASTALSAVDPLPAGLGTVGVLFIGVGSSNRHKSSHR